MPDNKHRVLVDNKQVVRQMLARILERIGYDRVSVEDPREALAYFGINYRQRDLAIIEHQLGEVTGADLPWLLLYIKWSIPTILISGPTKVLGETKGVPLRSNLFCPNSSQRLICKMPLKVFSEHGDSTIHGLYVIEHAVKKKTVRAFG